MNILILLCFPIYISLPLYRRSVCIGADSYKVVSGGVGLVGLEFKNQIFVSSL
jgi:hypothetical protein